MFSTLQQLDALNNRKIAKEEFLTLLENKNLLENLISPSNVFPKAKFIGVLQQIYGDIFDNKLLNEDLTNLKLSSLKNLEKEIKKEKNEKNKFIIAKRILKYYEQTFNEIASITKLAHHFENNGEYLEHAFKLTILFDIKALEYLKYFHKKYPNKQIVHDSCLFSLPSSFTKNFNLWKKQANNFEIFLQTTFQAALKNSHEIEDFINEQKEILQKELKEAEEEKFEPDESLEKRLNIAEKEFQKISKKEEIKKRNKRTEVFGLRSKFIMQLENKLNLSVTKELMHLISFNISKQIESLQKERKLLNKQNRYNLTDHERKEKRAELKKQISEHNVKLAKSYLRSDIGFSKLGHKQINAIFEFWKITNSPVLREFIQYGLSKEEFLKFTSLDRSNAGKYIPDLKVEKDNFYLKKIDVSGVNEENYDNAKLAALFGKIVGCCQHIGGVGGTCAIHSLTSPYGGLYGIFKDDILIGGSWAWIDDTSNILTFDSIDPPSLENIETITTLYNHMSYKIVKNFDIQQVNVGRTYRVKIGVDNKSLLQHMGDAKFKDYKGYHDSRQQRVIVQKDCLVYLFELVDNIEKDLLNEIKKVKSTNSNILNNQNLLNLLLYEHKNNNLIITTFLNKNIEKK